jgi:hypothetical protein
MPLSSHIILQHFGSPTATGSVYAAPIARPSRQYCLRERKSLELQVSDRWRHFVSDLGGQKEDRSKFIIRRFMNRYLHLQDVGFSTSIYPDSKKTVPRHQFRTVHMST